MRTCPSCQRDSHGICPVHEAQAERIAEERAGVWGDDW